MNKNYTILNMLMKQLVWKKNISIYGNIFDNQVLEIHIYVFKSNFANKIT